jgi:FkbM family methyltransferase
LLYHLINFYARHFSFPRRGWKYFRRFLKYFKLDKKEFQKKIANGALMNVTPVSHIDQQLFWYGYYEKPLALLLERILKPDSVFFDIGANIGYFSLIAAKKSKEGMIYSFEPVKELFHKLKLNLEENEVQNVRAFCLAVGENKDESVIYLSGPDNPGMSSMKPAENFSGTTQPTGVISIDDWMKESGTKRPDIIKLDVEGSELLALKGMKLTLSEHKPFLIVEISAVTLSRFQTRPGDVFHYLFELGYKSFDVTHTGELKEKAGSLPEENVVFIHKDNSGNFEFD